MQTYTENDSSVFLLDHYCYRFSWLCEGTERGGSWSNHFLVLNLLASTKSVTSSASMSYFCLPKMKMLEYT